MACMVGNPDHFGFFSQFNDDDDDDDDESYYFTFWLCLQNNKESKVT